jgi:hypothetical protein
VSTRSLSNTCPTPCLLPFIRDEIGTRRVVLIKVAPLLIPFYPPPDAQQHKSLAMLACRFRPQASSPRALPCPPLPWTGAAPGSKVATVGEKARARSRSGGRRQLPVVAPMRSCGGRRPRGAVEGGAGEVTGLGLKERGGVAKLLWSTCPPAAPRRRCCATWAARTNAARTEEPGID